MHEGFGFIDELVPGVRWDAVYAGSENFTGAPVDGYETDRVIGSLALCEGLVRARDAAASLGLGLLVWDGYRPQRAVDAFLRWAAAPEDGRTRHRHYPRIERAQIVDRGYVARRSGHTRGSAVDLTLFSLDSSVRVRMGGGHDLMDERSRHGAAGLDPDETRHRRTLRHVMEASGFRAFESEWWHYSLEVEPYPDRYFDFPVAP